MGENRQVLKDKQKSKLSWVGYNTGEIEIRALSKKQLNYVGMWGMLTIRQ